MVVMKKVFVARSGTMGKDIVQACAQSGYAVAMMDIDDTMLQKSHGRYQLVIE